MASVPKSEFYTSGRYGIGTDPLANLIAGKEFLNAVHSFSADDFMTIQDQVINRSKKEGVNIVRFSSPKAVRLKYKQGDPETITSNEPYGSRDTTSYLDVSEVVSETGADKVLVIHLRRFGVIRHTSGPIFTGKPNGFSQVQAYLVNTNNEVEWELRRHGLGIQESVVGEWKQKPDYPNLEQAAKKSLDSAREHILNALFP